MVQKLQNTLQTLGRFLNKFNQFDFKRWQDWLALLMVLFAFGVVVLRAITEPLIYDEAYTYFNTGRIQDFWQIYQFRIANTHIVNSLAMTVTTLFFPFSDTAIRLPNIITAGCYFVIAWGVAKKFKNAILVLAFLIFYHYLITLMSMARGYGMAACFLLASYYIVQYKELFKKFYVTAIVMLLLAFYSNYVALFPAGMMAFAIWMTEFNFQIPEFTKKQKRWYIGLTLLGIYGFYFVTLEGKPLYGAYDMTFIEAIPQDIIQRYLPSVDVATSYTRMATLIFTVSVLALFAFTRKNIAGIIVVISLGVIGLIALITGKPLPTGRVLIPFWPFIALAFMELLEYITPKNKNATPIILFVNLCVAGLIIHNFYDQIHVQERLANYNNQWRLPIKAMQTFQKELRPEEQYYVEKENYHSLFKSQLNEFKSEHSETKAYNQTYYPALRLVQLKFKSPEGPTKITRTAHGGDISATGIDYLLPNRDHYDYQFVLPEVGKFESLTIKGDNGFEAVYHLN